MYTKYTVNGGMVYRYTLTMNCFEAQHRRHRDEAHMSQGKYRLPIMDTSESSKSAGDQVGGSGVSGVNAAVAPRMRERLA